MFKRKLTALDYPNANKFDHSNAAEFKSLVVWLEDQKIRHYKIEDREGLRGLQSPEWDSALKKYLEELSFPGDFSQKTALLDWLLGYAVRLEYGDNVEKYKVSPPVGNTGGAGKAVSSNPLDSMDFQSPDFKAGVASIAMMLQIPPHPDHLQQLQAVCIFICEKLSKDKLEKLKTSGIKKMESLPLDKLELGFETSDYITAEAAKILRVLHVRELRDLQTLANQAIVNVQSITANPKTDTRLGKVGMK